MEHQKSRLLALFEANLDRPIPLPAILAMGISQYGSRIYELRKEGHIIENKIIATGAHGERHTQFTYRGKRSEP